MSRKANFYLSLLILSVFVLLIISCNKDENNYNSDQQELSVQFIDNYGGDNGWVILHNAEGTAASKYKSYKGNSLTDFGKINSNQATITLIIIDTILHSGNYLSTNIRLSTYYNSPAGKWIFTGNNYTGHSFGYADITIYYPEDNYSSLLVSETASSQPSGYVPVGEYNRNSNVNKLDNNKLSMYGAVYSYEEGGQCGWLIDQEFQIGETNYYGFDLNTPMQNKTINFNSKVYGANLYGCWNQRNSRLLISWPIIPTLTYDADFSYPIEMPITDWFLKLHASGSTAGGIRYFKYFEKSTGLPNAIDIPDHYVTATYNISNKEIENIKITGKADQIIGYWKHFSSGLYITWNIYGSTNMTSLKQPVLPDEILQEIGEQINLLEIQDIEITDYNTTSSHNDIVNRFFIQNVPVNERYDEMFNYYRTIMTDQR